MSTKHDDFDAAKTIVQALEPFEPSDKEKIIRWVCEKLGIIQQTISQTLPQRDASPETTFSHNADQAPNRGKDIKSFLSEKAPKSDNQFAAAVAYYYMFEAPHAQRKNSINKDDLVEATRKGGTRRLTRPDQTLVNAHNTGLLDKGTDKGTYTINTVGENLVAMIMPTTTGKVKLKPKNNKKRIPAAKKKAAKKK